MTQNKLPLCWSCHDTGRDSWCQLCKTSTEVEDKPKVDVFGVPFVEGRVGTWLQTYSGRQCWPRSPRPEDIAIEDIAVGLARECRYGKQTLRWYSVAEHSVIVSILAQEVGNQISQEYGLAVAKEGLFHDCDESPLHDMPRPLKYDPEMGLDSYRTCAANYRSVVFRRFGIRSTKETHELIDTIDKRLVVDEINQLMRYPHMYLERHGTLKPTGVKIPALEHGAATELFLSRFAELFPEELK